MTPDQMRDASLLELFKLEAEAQTQVLSSGLMVLERNPRQADQLEACMRAAHSLKGAARIVGIEAGVRIAHVMEDCLVGAQEGRLQLQSEHVDALLQGSDLLLRLGSAAGADWADKDGRAQIDALVERLQALASGQRVAPREPGARYEPVAESVVLPTVAAPEEEHLASAPATGESRDRVLRVSAERLDHLLDISSKSLVEFQRIKPLGDALQRLKRLQASAARTLDGVREAVQDDAMDAPSRAMLAEARQLLGECQQMLARHMADLDEFGWQGGQRAQLMYDAALASRMKRSRTSTRSSGENSRCSASRLMATTAPFPRQAGAPGHRRREHPGRPRCAGEARSAAHPPAAQCGGPWHREPRAANRPWQAGGRAHPPQRAPPRRHAGAGAA